MVAAVLARYLVWGQSGLRQWSPARPDDVLDSWSSEVQFGVLGIPAFAAEPHRVAA